ncbi:MAG: hypothetical protein MUC92_02135 [Fimbriimonadaceae bacterium]|jgi:hypothetical protein|nr:hypothetical protein [Fimbriimonadaceae bacterium]
MRVETVQIMMKWPLYGAAIALLALGGCQRQAEKTATETKPQEVAQTRSTTAPTPTDQNADDPSKATVDDGAMKQIKGAMDQKIPARVFAVKPGRDLGYSPAPKTESPDLGDNVDTALTQVKEGLVSGEMTESSSDGQLRGAYQFKIRSSEVFDIEWYRADSGATMNRLVADGKRRGHFDGEKWQTKANPKSKRKLSRMTAAQVEEWLSDPVMSGFDVYRNGVQSWGALFRALRQGVGGFQSQVETRQVTVNKEQRSLYRLTAKRGGASPAEVEFVIDGEKYYPLTIRVNKKRSDGTDYKFLWTGNWSFGGKHDDREFVIPIQ